MSKLQLLIYFLLRSLAKFVIFGYFKKVYVHHKENFKLKGPTIIVSNHPNTLIDPVIVASRIQQPIYFLANASLFKNPFFANILRYLFCIEVKRFEDTGNKNLDNTASFEQSSQHLASNGNIYIAVEGTSYMERVLRPLKTGFARIGFQALTGAAKGKEIFVLPIGLNYEKHDKSGYDLEINVGESIPLSQYLDSYEKDNQTSVKVLTQELSASLKSLVIHTVDVEEENWLLQIDAFLFGKTEKEYNNAFDRFRKILPHIRIWEEKRSISAQSWKNNFIELTQLLLNFHLPLRTLSMIYFNSFPALKLCFIIFLGLPIYIISFLNHFFAIWVPRWIKWKLNLYVGYDSTVKILSAIVLAPLAYLAQFYLVYYFLSDKIAFLNLIFLPFSAWFLFFYERNFKLLKGYFTWVLLSEPNKEKLKSRFNHLFEFWEKEEKTIKIMQD